MLRILATSDLGAATWPLRTSYGESGTIAGVVELLERSREKRPTVWLELGDLVVGHPSFPLLGERPWDDVAGLPIAAAAAGNHDFDDGLDALHAAAARLSFPLLAANVDGELAATAVVESEAGSLGVIGLTNPRVDALSGGAPAPVETDVGALARALRRDGARWVVALLHDGVEWWPQGRGIVTRSTRLEGVVRHWAHEVDLILGGHNFGAWSGTLGGTPFAERTCGRPRWSWSTSRTSATSHRWSRASGASLPSGPSAPARRSRPSALRASGSWARCPSSGSRAPAPSATCRTCSRARSAAQPAPTPASCSPATTASRRRSTA